MPSPPGSTAQRLITVILNTAAGHDDKQTVRERIEQELVASGRPFRILTPQTPGELPQLVRRVVEEAEHVPQIVASAGGDGTTNTVAAGLVGTGVPLACIPLGTFNYFARNLGIPLDPAAAVRAICNGEIRHTSVARVNGHVFLINSSFGLYRRLQEERELRKRRFGRNKVIAVLSGVVTLLKYQRTYAVQLQLDDEPLALRTPMIFFGMNALQLEKLGLPEAECAARGLLAVLVLRPMSRLALLGVALKGALQRLDSAENLQCYCASSVQVQWRAGHRMKVAVDGETIECTLPLRVEAMRDALVVVVPLSPEPRQ